MIRYSIFLACILGMTVSAVAAAGGFNGVPDRNPLHVNVIVKNDAFPVFGPVTADECAIEDCSDE